MDFNQNDLSSQVAQAYKSATGVDMPSEKLAQRVSEIGSGQTSFGDWQTALQASDRAQLAQAYKAATGSFADQGALESLRTQYQSGAPTDYSSFISSHIPSGGLQLDTGFGNELTPTQKSVVTGAIGAQTGTTPDLSEQIAESYKQATGVDIPADKLAQRIAEISSGQTTLGDWQSALQASDRAQLAQAYKAATGNYLDANSLENYLTQSKSISDLYKQATGLEMPEDKLLQRTSEIASGKTTLGDYQASLAASNRAQIAQAYHNATGQYLDANQLEDYVNQVKSGKTGLDALKTQIAPVSYFGDIYARDEYGNLIQNQGTDEYGNPIAGSGYQRGNYGFDTGYREGETWDQYQGRVNDYYGGAVGKMYEGILGRQASAEELNNIANQYGGWQNIDLAQVQKDLALSPQAQANAAKNGTWLTLTNNVTTQKTSPWGYNYEVTEPATKAVYIPPSVASLPDAMRDIYSSENPQQLIDKISADPATWAKDKLLDDAYLIGWINKIGGGEAYLQAASRGYSDSNEYLNTLVKNSNDTAKWLLDNKVVTEKELGDIWKNQVSIAETNAQRNVLDQIHNDDSGFLGLGKVGEQVGDFLEKYEVPIMTAILGGAVLAPAAIGAAGLTAGSAGASALTGGVTGLTSAAGALANGADWKNALLSGGLAGLTAGTLHGLGGLGGGAGAIDSGVAGSTVDQASVDAFLSGASGKLTPAELVDYANFFADQGYNVGNLDMVSSWSPFAQETFQRAVDMGIDPSFAATKIQEGLLDTGVPGSVLDQSSVNAMLQENPEYAQFFKGQGYNVDAAKGLTSVDSIHNQLVSAFDDAYKTNIADLMKVYEPTAQTNVTIYGTEYTTDVPVGSSTVTRPDIGTSGGASETSATVAEVGGKIDDAAKIVSDAATKTPETTVKELYKTLLDRAPETEALKYWSDLIASGASTAGGVAGSIIGSAEFGGKIGAGTGGAGGGTGTGPGTGGGSGPGGSGSGTGPGGSGSGGDVEGPVTEGGAGGAGGTTVVPPVVVPPSGGGGGGTETPTTEPTTKTPTPKIPSTPSLPTITLPKVAGSGSGGVLQHFIPNLTADIVGGTGVFEPTKDIVAKTYTVPQISSIFDLFASPSSTKRGYADGGLVATEHQPEFYSEGGLNNRYVTGNGDGTSDDVPAMLANGEFVIPADVVSALGNGSNDSGAAVLDEFLSTIRSHKQKHDPKELPPDSLGALAYLKKATKKAGK